MIYKKEKKAYWLALLLVCLPFNAVFGVEMKGLFEIELIARSQQPEDREFAIRQALFAVLERVVVADDIARLPVVQQVLNGAIHYVKQFQYSLISPDNYSEGDARLLRVEFDQEQLLEVMRQSGVGVWTEIRPQTLFWLVVDQGGTRQFFNPDSMPEVESALSLAAKIKGLPIIFPMLDLEEQQRISVSEVLGVDSKNLLAVSARYEVPAVMAGRIFRKGQCWQGEWIFYFDAKIKQWSNDCLPLKGAVLEGMKGAYNELSLYYGIKPLRRP